MDHHKLTSRQVDQQLADMRRRILLAGIAVLSLLAIGTFGYTMIDNGEHPILDSLYMTVITLTTVGYGEIVPLDHHPWGRVFTMFILVFGAGILVYFASTVTAFIVEGQLNQVFWRKRMQKRIAELKEHFIVCGDGAVAGHVIDELRRVKRAVVSVVPAGSAPPELSDPGDLLWVEGDPADEEVLRQAGIMRAGGVVSAMESDRENILVVLAARQTNPILRIVSMLAEARSEQKMRRAGADAVVRPFLTGGMRMASELIRPKVVSFLDEMLRDRTQNLRIDEIGVGHGSPAIGKTVDSLRINDQRGVVLLALVEPDGQTYTFKPEGGRKVAEGATLIVMGGPDGLGELRQKWGGHLYQEVATTLERHTQTGLASPGSTQP